jgi:mRNA-degrading endonuclease RelE of RelBE toxin-antitoxin system
MEYRLSKEFTKSLERLSGKELNSALSMLHEVDAATSIFDITDCKKLTGYKNLYRIRIGSRRAFFTFHIEIIDDIIYFRYLVSRGQAYSKMMEKLLKNRDDE